MFGSLNNFSSSYPNSLLFIAHIISDGMHSPLQVNVSANPADIPMVVLTTSEAQQDKVESFNLGVAGYMAMPVDYQHFVEAMRSINTNWTLSEMPQ